MTHACITLFYRSRLGALLSATDPRAVLISGGCFAVGSTLYILSMQLASVAAVSCVSATSGLFAALLARVWLGERAGPGFYAAMALAIAGIAVIAFSESAAPFNGLAAALHRHIATGLASKLVGMNRLVAAFKR